MLLDYENNFHDLLEFQTEIKELHEKILQMKPLLIILSKSTTWVVNSETANATSYEEWYRITALGVNSQKISGITIVCVSLIYSDSLKIVSNFRFFCCLGLDLFLFGTKYIHTKYESGLETLKARGRSVPADWFPSQKSQSFTKGPPGLGNGGVQSSTTR